MRVLITGPLDGATLARVERLVRARTTTQITRRTIALNFSDPLSLQARSEISAICTNARLDNCFEQRRVTLSQLRILALDMDSTLITTECIDALAGLVGKSEEVAVITEAAMRGELKNFAASLTARVALLKGAPSSILETVFQEKVKLSDGAGALIDAARRLSITTVLVSGGFTYFTERLQKQLALDYTLANQLEVTNDRLTGRVLNKIIDGSAKAAYVSKVAKTLKASHDQIMAIGDGANDIPMMKLAGTSIAYHAKPIVKRIATHSIDFFGLDTILDWMCPELAHNTNTTIQ